MSRTVPPLLLAHYRQPYRTLARCWFIRPRVGPVEAYTSLNRNLALPAFEVGTDLEVPTLNYLCAGGVESATIPARLNLSKSGSEVSALAFDRGRLLRGYYEGAEFEAFIVNYNSPAMGRDVVVSGRIGAADVGVVGANVELVPWNAFAEMELGRTCNQLCDVGIYPGEQFGTKRCRNVTLQDGPLRANWSVLASVQNVVTAHSLTVSFGSQAVSGAALPTGFLAHLESGDVEFLTTSQGGQNAGVEMQVKGAVGNAGAMALALHGDLPFLPSAGDGLVLVAGCRRTASDCTFFKNKKNFQGFDLLPGKIGVFNEKEES